MLRFAIVALAVLAAASSARAAADEVVAITYTAPPSCPDRAALEAAVQARTPLVRFAPDARRTFSISISERDGDFVGTFSVTDDPASLRELSSHRCDDLVGALALITALSIDPAATVEWHPTAPAPRPHPPEPPPPPWPVDGDALAGVAFGITSDAMPALAIEGRAAPRPYLALAVAALVGYDSAALDVGSAEFVWAVARPSACWRPLHGRFELDACGHAEIGAMRARGRDIVLGQSVTRAWFAAGLHAEATWAITPTVFLKLQLGASAPFQRDRFLFQPSMTIHQTSAVTEWMGAGVGMRFR